MPDLAWLRRWRSASEGRLFFGADWRLWLSEKLRLEADDERLDDIARKLAAAGKLTILVDGNRVVGAALPAREIRARIAPECAVSGL
jgi:hypothetical protein